MGNYLANKGYTVLGLRLSGHGTDPRDMNRVRWQDWIADVEDGWYMLSGLSKRIFLVGHSMGGSLALLYAMNHRIEGVVGISTVYRIPHGSRPKWLRLFPRSIQLRLIKLYSRAHPFIVKGSSYWVDQEAHQQYFSYEVNPVPAGLELQQMLVQLRVSLPQIDVPTLLIHSSKDSFIEHKQSELIFEQLSHKDKELITLDNSGHILPMDAERDRVFKETSQFIERLSKRRS